MHTGLGLPSSASGFAALCTIADCRLQIADYIDRQHHALCPVSAVGQLELITPQHHDGAQQDVPQRADGQLQMAFQRRSVVSSNDVPIDGTRHVDPTSFTPA